MRSKGKFLEVSQVGLWMFMDVKGSREESTKAFARKFSKDHLTLSPLTEQK